MISVKVLIEAGVHFGHRASRWHPNMSPYIHGKHNQIHIIDLRQTLRGLIRGSHFLNRLAEHVAGAVAAGETRDGTGDMRGSRALKDRLHGQSQTPQTGPEGPL